MRIHAHAIHGRQVECQRGELGANPVTDDQSRIDTAITVIGNDEPVQITLVAVWLRYNAAAHGTDRAEFLQLEDVDAAHHELPHVVELGLAIAAEDDGLVGSVALVRVVDVGLLFLALAEKELSA